MTTRSNFALDLFFLIFVLAIVGDAVASMVA